ncbi:hypothetical protein [Siminovitchia sp. 179-K 8D1 HS]|uniref:hypothetical protein n=1 Tax=Siminovitchia sp. 179-K 8D1 HS TaxID=3142385 RepID=UPI00399F0616
MDVEVLDNDSGKSVRFFVRDVFDFGVYNYPKRVNGTDDVFNRENWTSEEKAISKWLNEFNPFGNCIRM